MEMDVLLTTVQTSVSHQILRLLLGKDLGSVKDDGLNTAGVLFDGFLRIK